MSEYAKNTLFIETPDGDYAIAAGEIQDISHYFSHYELTHDDWHQRIELRLYFKDRKFDFSKAFDTSEANRKAPNADSQLVAVLDVLIRGLIDSGIIKSASLVSRDGQEAVFLNNKKEIVPTKDTHPHAQIIVTNKDYCEARFAENTQIEPICLLLDKLNVLGNIDLKEIDPRQNAPKPSR